MTSRKDEGIERSVPMAQSRNENTETIDRAKRYLACYRSYATVIEMIRRGQAGDELDIRAEAFAIRRSVLRLPESKEKLLLYHYYIQGNTMEACAELLGISRRTVFRLMKRALEMYVLCNPKDKRVYVIES